MFDFQLDEQLKNLHHIWKKYIYNPTKNSNNAITSLKDQVNLNPIRKVKKELYSPNKNQDYIDKDENMETNLINNKIK